MAVVVDKRNDFLVTENDKYWWRITERERKRERKREIENLRKKNPIVLVSKCIVVKASVNSDGFTFTVSACSGIEM